MAENLALINGFGWGILGGVLPEFYVLYNLRQDFHKHKPQWVKSWFYWIVTIVMITLGGGAVVFYLYSGTNVTPLLAIHIGAATPTLIGSLIKEKPDFEPGV